MKNTDVKMNKLLSGRASKERYHKWTNCKNASRILVRMISISKTFARWSKTWSMTRRPSDKESIRINLEAAVTFSPADGRPSKADNILPKVGLKTTKNKRQPTENGDSTTCRRKKNS